MEADLHGLLERHAASAEALLAHPLFAPHRAKPGARKRPFDAVQADTAGASVLPLQLLPHHSADAAGPAPDAWTACSLDELRLRLQSFAAERDWDKFHTPRNLALALVGEVGELCECFQWKGDHGAPLHLPDWPADKKTHLGEELSDCLMYLIRLSDKVGIDLPAACLRKMHRNAIKYPAHLVRGSSKKYDEYETGEATGVEPQAARE